MRKFILLTVICVLALPIEAAVYRCEQADGTVKYTDTPCDHGGPVKFPPLPTYTPAPIQPSISAPPPVTKQTDFQYKQIVIQTPAHDATVRQDAGQVSVGVIINPPLQVPAGHKMILAVDGQHVGEPVATTVFQLNNVDRGSHTLEAVVVGDDGSEIGRSPPVTFHMKRFSALHPQQKRLKQEGEQQQPQPIPQPQL